MIDRVHDNSDQAKHQGYEPEADFNNEQTCRLFKAAPLSREAAPLWSRSKRGHNPAPQVGKVLHWRRQLVSDLQTVCGDLIVRATGFEPSFTPLICVCGSSGARVVI